MEKKREEKKKREDGIISRNIFLIIGIICVLSAIYIFYNDTIRNRECTESTTGKITGIRSEYSSYADQDGVNTAIVYYVTVQYLDRTDEFIMGSKDYYKTQSVVVKYNPNNPDIYIIEGDKSNFNSAIGGIIFGIVCFVFHSLKYIGGSKSFVDNEE